MDYKINSRFRRFGSRTDQLTGLSVYYIELSLPKARGGSAIPRPQDRLNSGSRHEPETISPCTITMDHDAIIYFMIDRLPRGPDQDVHVPSVVGPKYPSRGVDGIYLYLTIVGVVWGPMRPLLRFLGALG